METTKELKAIGKVGLWITLATNLFYLIELVILFVYFVVNLDKVVSFHFLGINLSKDVYVFLFVLAPILIGLSIFFNFMVLTKKLNYQSQAILFGFLSGSLIGSILLWIGKVPMPKAEVPEEYLARFPKTNHRDSRLNGRTVPQFQQNPIEELLLKYAKLFEFGMITEEEYNRIKKRFVSVE